MVFQTRKVYKAFNGIPHWAMGEKLDREGAEKLISLVKNSVWWANRTKVENVELTFIRRIKGRNPEIGAVKESWKRGILAMVDSKLYPATILHELAHIVFWPKPGASTHDEYFAGAWLYLVRRYISEEAADELQAAFERHGVKWIYSV